MALTCTLMSITLRCEAGVMKHCDTFEVWYKRNRFYQSGSDASINATPTQLREIQMSGKGYVIEYSGRTQNLRNELQAVCHSVAESNLNRPENVDETTDDGDWALSTKVNNRKKFNKYKIEELCHCRKKGHIVEEYFSYPKSWKYKGDKSTDKPNASLAKKTCGEKAVALVVRTCALVFNDGNRAWPTWMLDSVCTSHRGERRGSLFVTPPKKKRINCWK